MDDLKDLYVDVDTGEWIAQDPQGDYRTRSMIGEQQDPAHIWEFTHNQNSNRFVCQVFSNGSVVYPENTRIVNSNTIRLYFNEPISGQANLMFFD